MLDHFINRIAPFVLTFAVSILLAAAFQSLFLWGGEPRSTQALSEPKTNGFGSGFSGPGDIGGSKPLPEEVRGPTAPYLITFQPKARYTDAARVNNVQGSVRLKITLLASGHIGAITPVTELPDGLTEQAIAAAKQIKFDPKRVNGVPVSVVITREYTFTIY